MCTNPTLAKNPLTQVTACYLFPGWTTLMRTAETTVFHAAVGGTIALVHGTDCFSSLALLTVGLPSGRRGGLAGVENTSLLQLGHSSRFNFLLSVMDSTANRLLSLGSRLVAGKQYTGTLPCSPFDDVEPTQNNKNSKSALKNATVDPGA